jgi:2,4-dienoyl-CoA reductase-like NADH-dependent reductase (Old Yellow Enzyme family)
MNLRTDGWGGELAGARAAGPLETLRAVRAAVPGFVVGVRLSPEDFGQARGLDLDENDRGRALAVRGRRRLHPPVAVAHSSA